MLNLKVHAFFSCITPLMSLISLMILSEFDSIHKLQFIFKHGFFVTLKGNNYILWCAFR